MKRLHIVAFVAVISSAAAVLAADAAWKWSGSYGSKAVTMLIIGDIDIQRRADPTKAFGHIGETLKGADLV